MGWASHETPDSINELFAGRGVPASSPQVCIRLFRPSHFYVRDAVEHKGVISYTLAWKPQDSNVEYAVCLANVVLSKNENPTDNNTALW
jgi:hypothetical protein